MRNWTKLGLRATLVAGGLLMLGTGIASADENVNPDVPASPLDLHAGTPEVASLAERLQQLAPANLGEATSLPSVVRAVVPDVENGVLTPQSASSVFTVPAQLLRYSPAASANSDEPQINVPVGHELKATDLPALPVLPLLKEMRNTVSQPADTTITPVNGDLPALPLPVHGGVSTTPGAADDGALANVPTATASPVVPTRPVKLQTPAMPQNPAMPQTPAMPQNPALSQNPAMPQNPALSQNPALAQNPAMSQVPGTPPAAALDRGDRADVPNLGSPLTGLPLLGQLPLTDSVLPTRLPLTDSVLPTRLPLADSVLPTRLLNRPGSTTLPLVRQLQRMPLDGGASPFAGGDVTPQSAVQKLAARLTGLIRK